MLFSSHPPTSNNIHHPPSPDDRSLRGAVLGHQPPCKADCLIPHVGHIPHPTCDSCEGAPTCCSACWPGTGSEGRPLPGGRQPVPQSPAASGSPAALASGAQGSRVPSWGQKPCPQPRHSSPVLGAGGLQRGRGGGRPGQAAALLPLDSACTWLQSGGQREDQSECVPCFSTLSPKDAPNLSAPSTGIVASPRVSYLPRPDPPCSGHCGCGRGPACVPQPGFRIFGQHQRGTLS